MNQQIPVDLEEEQTEAPIQPHYEHGESSSQAQQEEPVEEDHDHNQRNPRTRKRPNWMIDYEMDYDSSDSAYFAFFMDSDSIVYEEAIKEKKWKEVKDSEIKSIEKNKTWELTNLIKGQKTIGVKWVFKTKLNEHGEVDKYKARLVAKEYKQTYGVDYKEVFAPVAHQDTIRLIIISIAAPYLST